MRSRPLLIASAIAIGLATPAIAQQSTSARRYVGFFKYTDQAIKAMTENPQDRAAPVAKLTEAFGGKLESIYFFPTGGEWDGMVISQMPSDADMASLNLIVRSTGNLAKLQSIPVMTAAEFKAAAEKAKSTTTGYTPPTAARQ
jgi:uncharacterized protein with GYD domain